jgi:uncharacterized membrane protein
MKPTIVAFLVLGAITQFILVSCLHWSFQASAFAVSIGLSGIGLSTLGFIWMFVPAAQRPELLSEICSDLNEFRRTLTSR